MIPNPGLILDLEVIVFMILRFEDFAGFWRVQEPTRNGLNWNRRLKQNLPKPNWSHPEIRLKSVAGLARLGLPGPSSCLPQAKAKAKQSKAKAKQVNTKQGQKQGKAERSSLFETVDLK